MSYATERSHTLGISCAYLIAALLAVFPLQQRHAHSSGPTPELQTLLQTAQEALGRKDFSTAVKALKSVVQVLPDSAPAWFNLAYAYSGLNQNENAVRTYEKTLQLQPDLYEARLNLGILLIEMKRPEAALQHLEKAVVLQPQQARAHLYYGRALGLAGQPEAAEKQLEEAVHLAPSLAIGHYDVGELYLTQKKYAEARTAFQKAAELDVRLLQAQLGLALASEGLHLQDDAVAYFERYLAAKPDDLETRFHLARIYLQQERTEQALANLKVVYQENPKLPGIVAALGDVYALLKQFPESEKFYRKALDDAPREPDLHRALGQTLLEQAKLSESESEFRAALQFDPRNREAAKGLATSLYLEKRYQEAIPLLESLIRSPDPPAGLLFVLATCYDHMEDRPRALEAYEKFLSRSTGSPDQEWQARQRIKVLRRDLRK